MILLARLTSGSKLHGLRYNITWQLPLADTMAYEWLLMTWQQPCSNSSQLVAGRFEQPLSCRQLLQLHDVAAGGGGVQVP